MDAAAEIGRNPVSKHQIQSEYYGDEQADAGRDCRTRLERPNSQARTGTGKYLFVVLGLRCLLDCHVLKGFGIYMIGILDRLY